MLLPASHKYDPSGARTSSHLLCNFSLIAATPARSGRGAGAQGEPIETVESVTTPLHAHAGELLLRRYRLRERLGSGGFGEVWAAKDELLGRMVALKRIPGGEPERATREAQAAARLSHASIVALYEACSEDGVSYLITELVDGQTLAQLIAKDALADEEILRISLALCDALQHAHDRGVVHRDVKPHNILVPSDRSDPAVAKLTDFGGARLDGEQPLTATGDVLGTLAYMAPEQSEARAAGPAADLYSLALVTYEALTGENPVRAASAAATVRRIGTQLPALMRLRPDLPPGLCEAIDRALHRSPERRGTLTQLAEAVREALHQMTVSLRDARPGHGGATLRPSGAQVDARGGRGGRQSALTDAGTALTQSEPALTQSETALTQSQTALTQSETALTQSETALTHAETESTAPTAPTAPSARTARTRLRTLAEAPRPAIGSDLQDDSAQREVEAEGEPSVSRTRPSAPSGRPGRPSSGILPIPRALWLLALLAAIAWAFASSRPGLSVILLAGALPLLLIMPSRAGPSWLVVPALAPALGLSGLALAYPAFAALQRSPYRRFALGALGFYWVCLTQLATRTALAGAILLSGQLSVEGSAHRGLAGSHSLPSGSHAPPHFAPPPPRFLHSVSASAHALLPLISVALLGAAAVWGLCALIGPPLLSRCSLPAAAALSACWSVLVMLGPHVVTSALGPFAPALQLTSHAAQAVGLLSAPAILGAILAALVVLISRALVLRSRADQAACAAR